MGIYFITQNPLDLPESVLGQLGNRVQHALRAFTPKDQKAVKQQQILSELIQTLKLMKQLRNLVLVRHSLVA